MREIKFRAFCLKRKIMTEVKGQDFAWLGETALLQPNRWAVMQFTGLKDKNGKEIYEGDIMGQENGANCKVEFQTDEIVCASRLWCERITKVLSWGYKVIGNIYSDPELLK